MCRPRMGLVQASYKDPLRNSFGVDGRRISSSADRSCSVARQSDSHHGSSSAPTYGLHIQTLMVSAVDIEVLRSLNVAFLPHPLGVIGQELRGGS